jgi:hypothetical protein
MVRSAARLRYAKHKAHAKERGIEFDLTFEEWWGIWEPRWAERGTHKDQLGMCRTRDQGPYAVGNIRLDTPKGNAAERGLMQRCSRTYWFPTENKQIRTGAVFKSYGNAFARPDTALERQQEEYEWIPGE